MVAHSRERVIRILRREDPRLLVVIGPCSIHDEKGALDYAGRLNALREEFAGRREMASGLSMPVGLKNSTDGSLQVAIEAMGAARHPHSFLGIDQDGVTSIVRTAGNPDAHIVLRGGRAQTNFDAASIRAAEEKLKSENLPPVLMVDCSHANSEK